MTRLARLVASDIDGTLVGSSCVPSARTIHVLASVAARGVGIVLITGRSLRRVRPLHA
jgi:hydroxymethylpyrimidine pyrophosphatase-like HAD family hydrolase